MRGARQFFILSNKFIYGVKNIKRFSFKPTFVSKSSVLISISLLSFLLEKKSCRIIGNIDHVYNPFRVVILKKFRLFDYD